ncbi:MAG: DsrE family protein [Chloroflexi bacterium]|nr:DsrE family protein [Chloroflexota bacterium]
MAKVAIALLTGTDEREHARVFHALLYTKGLVESGQEVKLIFDGAGTGWVQALADPKERLNSLFTELKGSGVVAGACEFCSAHFASHESIRQAGVSLLAECGGHPDIASLIGDGYQLVVI